MKLSVRGLGFSYDSSRILDNVTFDAEQGECVAILGINGAGKSTLLKCIDGILRCQEGAIEADGVDLTRLKPLEMARTVGYVPQQLVFSESAVFDAVLMGRRPYIRHEVSPNDLEIVSGLLGKMNLSSLAVRNVNELSGGEQQKVAIARALAQQPRILLFDEPTSNLDIKNQIEVIRLIRSVAAENGITVIVTMHDLNLALEFADRFILMKDNSITAVGGKEIITSETIRFVYGIDAEVASVAGRTVVVPI